MIDYDQAKICNNVVCRELPGNVTYSDGLNIGSVASYQCDNGIQQIQCGNSGWSGFLCGETFES